MFSTGSSIKELVYFFQRSYNSIQMKLNASGISESDFPSGESEKSDDLVEGVQGNQNKIPCSKYEARVVKVIESKQARREADRIAAEAAEAELADESIYFN